MERAVWDQDSSIGQWLPIFSDRRASHPCALLPWQAFALCPWRSCAAAAVPGSTHQGEKLPWSKKTIRKILWHLLLEAVEVEDRAGVGGMLRCTPSAPW